MTTPKLTPLEQHAVDLLLRSICADDDDLARALAWQAAEALIDVAREAWGKRLQTAREALELAERALELAEAEPNPQKRQKQLDLFEHYMSAAEVVKSNAQPRAQRVH